jgi:anti-sigma factor RsiW
MKHITDRQLSAFIDDDLSARERAFVDAHCAECPRCARRKQEYTQIQRALRGLPQPEIQEDYALTRIRARIASGETEKRGSGWLTSNVFGRSLAVLGTAALIAFALFFTLTHSGNQNLLDEKMMLTQDFNIVERETDDIIRGYQDMRQLYYF